MTALDSILDGLEAELELERELGVRVFEVDRAVLAPISTLQPDTSKTSAHQSANDPREIRENPRHQSQSNAYDLVFLHEKPLSPKGAEMMAKIVAAMGKTVETAPVVHAPPLPPAKAYVVLGGLSLRTWFPGQNASPGARFTTSDGADVLVTYSPEYILRFGTVTPAVKKIKQDMWASLKDLMRRVRHIGILG